MVGVDDEIPATIAREAHENWWEQSATRHGGGAAASLVNSRRNRSIPSGSPSSSTIHHHGGAEVPPVLLLCDHSGVRVFLALLRSVLAGQDRDATKISFARALHGIGEDGHAEAIAGEVDLEPCA